MARLLSIRSLRPALRSSAPATLPLSTARLSSTFDSQPSPPRLPPDQQAEFERLQRAAEARLNSHVSQQPQQQQQQPPPSPPATSRPDTSPSPAAETFSGGIRQGAPPEFEGDVNPQTREVGGPKNEPLRWGSGGDWSYNGRVTDF